MADALVCSGYWLAGLTECRNCRTSTQHLQRRNEPRTLTSCRLCASGAGTRAPSRHLPLLSCIGGGHLAKLRA